MKETNNNNRIYWLNIRLNKAEQAQIIKQFNKTTEKKLGTYARNVLLDSPMIAGYKNLSMDEEIKAFAVLVKTLNGFANNYNQTVHKLHTLNNDAEIKSWMKESEITFRKMQESIEEIKLFMKKNTEKWLLS